MTTFGAALLLSNEHAAHAAVDSCQAVAVVYAPAPSPAPLIVDVGLRPSDFTAQAVFERGVMWIKTQPSPYAEPAAQERYVFERAWGLPPPGWYHLFSETHSADTGVIVLDAEHDCDLHLPGAPFGFGFVARQLDDNSKASSASEPFYVSYAGDAAATPGIRGDQVLFLVVALALALLWYWYRREPELDAKIRLAAASALGSVIVLSATPAMPWLVTSAPHSDAPGIECLLGQERACSTFMPPSKMPTVEEKHFAKRRWICAAESVRVGLVMALALLLPALIWLLVLPRNRPAQAAVAVGASAAAFTVMCIGFYVMTVPPWMTFSLYRTVDIALLTSANIALAAGLIVYHSFRTLRRTPHVPFARVRLLREWRS